MSEDSSVNPTKQLEQLQATCKMLTNTFKDETQDINRALQNYKYILTHYKNNSLYGVKCREYIFDNFLESSFKLLMRRRHQHFQREFNMADEITNCCQLLIEIGVPLINKDDHPLTTQIIYFCMNRASPFYRDFGHDWRQYRGDELKQEEIKENEEWRISEIKIGSHVDYLMCNRWRYGEIKKITNKKSESGGDEYKLLDIAPKMDAMYPNDGLFIDEWTLSKQTYGQIAKPLTKSIEKLPYMVEWRRNLGINENNNRCDVLDSNGKWCHGIIIETDAAANRIKVKYDGKESTFNEWIFKDAPNLQRYDHHENDNFIQSVQDEQDDDNDDDSLYAIYRGMLGEISYHLVGVLNQFGKSGGFEAILQKLTDEPAVSTQFLTFILRPLSKCWKVYTKSFGDKWLPKMYNVLIETIESLPQTQCTELTSRDCERIIAAITDYGRRHHSAKEIKEIGDKLTFKMLLRRLQCGTNDAATDIAKICADSTRNADKITDTVSTLIDWIEKNNVLRYLFGFNNVILCKSDVLIEGYVRENYDDHQSLSVDVLNLIKLWFDEDGKPSMMQHSVEVLEFINKEYELKTIDIEMIWNTLLSVTWNNKNNRLTMFDVIHKVYNMVGPIIMSKCIDNFIKHKYIISTIRILTGIWSSTDKDMRYTIIGHMIDNEKLLKYYCKEIVYFKDCVKNNIEKNEIEPSEINDIKLFNEEINYLQHITERIKFLEYISTNYNDLKFCDDEKDILYTHLIENALSDQEQKITVPILKSIIIENDDKYPLLK